jgi:hypothetical protein
MNSGCSVSRLHDSSGCGWVPPTGSHSRVDVFFGPFLPVGQTTTVRVVVGGPLGAVVVAALVVSFVAVGAAPGCLLATAAGECGERERSRSHESSPVATAIISSGSGSSPGA